MLKPAILYKEELLKKFAEYLYTDDYFWYTGCCDGNELPDIEPQYDKYKYAILDNDKLIGYFAYQIQYSLDTVCNFGLFSFDRGNPIIGTDVYAKMNELINEHRRVEWKMIGGNPIKSSYDNICKRFGGNCVKLNQVTKDIHGKYHDEYIYEVLRT